MDLNGMAKTSTERKKASRRAGTDAAPGRAVDTRERLRLEPALQRRVIVEGVHPQIDGGRFPVKPTAGEAVVVGGDMFTDGHGTLAAALLYRRCGDAGWHEVPMAALGNDRWQASFHVG